MDKQSILTQEVITFFDSCAPTWDHDMIRDDAVIDEILTNGGVDSGKTVLDVACGTGVLIPDYLKRETASVLGVDISPRMIELAEEKFRGEKSVQFLCADIFHAEIKQKFDCIMVYNAFPHFDDSEGLICRLAGMLKEDGFLTVAHGMSREQINRHHRRAASHVSKGLPDVEMLASVFENYLTVTTALSDYRMYQVTGCAVKNRGQ